MNNVKGYDLINVSKVDRALNGVQKNDGNFIGGIGRGAYRVEGVWKRDDIELSETEVDSLETALLAEYDKLGGLIVKGDDKVKTGSFYNIAARKPRAVPEVKFIYRIGGRVVEVPEGIELPGEVKAVKILATQIEEEKKTKKSKKSMNL